MHSHPTEVPRRFLTLLLLLSFQVTLLHAQGPEIPDCEIQDLTLPAVTGFADTFDETPGISLPDAPSAVADGDSLTPQRSSPGRKEQLHGFANNVQVRSRQTDWDAAGGQSFLFLSVQHSLRLLQPKTRRELKGKFFDDYVHSVEGIHGWGDGDGIFTNDFLHPAMGSIVSWIYIQNTPSARGLTFDPGSGVYWRSRLKAMAFAAAYSTQFEIGPISEASIGNVGLHKGTDGYTDFVMTPIGGFGLTVLEDYLDERFVKPMEMQTESSPRRRFFRIVMNPQRSLANLLRLRAPWYRDTRAMRTTAPPETTTATSHH